MKKVIFIAFIWILSVPSVFSQQLQDSELPAKKEPFKPEWAFGVNGGITLSKISFNPIVKQDYLQQYTGGITARYISERNVGLQVELNYSMRGWKERTDSVNLYSGYLSPMGRSNMVDSMYYTNYSRSIGYLELPLLTHICFDMGKHARFIVLLGPQISYYLNEKVLESDIVSAFPFMNPPSYDSKVQRKFDYGLLGGMGVEWRTGIGSFVLDGRYYFGLSDIFDNSRSDYYQASSNQVISIKMTYLFRK